MLVTIDPEEAEVLPEPKSKIDSINESGSVKLLFSQSMLFEETFGGFSFSSEANYDDISDEDEFRRRRMQETEEEILEVDLLSIADIEVKRGSFYNSAS